VLAEIRPRAAVDEERLDAIAIEFDFVNPRLSDRRRQGGAVGRGLNSFPR
jgi:hypothetical protein